MVSTLPARALDCRCDPDHQRLVSQGGAGGVNSEQWLTAMRSGNGEVEFLEEGPTWLSRSGNKCQLATTSKGTVCADTRRGLAICSNGATVSSSRHTPMIRNAKGRKPRRVPLPL